jgi:hypothetical protein
LYWLDPSIHSCPSNVRRWAGPRGRQTNPETDGSSPACDPEFGISFDWLSPQTEPTYGVFDRPFLALSPVPWLLAKS